MNNYYNKLNKKNQSIINDICEEINHKTIDDIWIKKVYKSKLKVNIGEIGVLSDELLPSIVKIYETGNFDSYIVIGFFINLGKKTKLNKTILKHIEEVASQKINTIIKDIKLYYLDESNMVIQDTYMDIKYLINKSEIKYLNINKLDGFSTRRNLCDLIAYQKTEDGVFCYKSSLECYNRNKNNLRYTITQNIETINSIVDEIIKIKNKSCMIPPELTCKNKFDILDFLQESISEKADKAYELIQENGYLKSQIDLLAKNNKAILDMEKR